MAQPESGVHWKSLYASDVFNWHHAVIKGKDTYYRRLGIVENLFDLDGIDYEGRADLTTRPVYEIKTQLTDDELRRRIILVWAYFRHLHPLLSCKSLYAEEVLEGVEGRRWTDKCFIYEKPSSRKEAIDSANYHTSPVLDSYKNSDMKDFYFHSQNTGRSFNEKEALARLFILPFQRMASGTIILSNIITAAHEIADGITMFRLAKSFLDLLNLKEQDLLERIDGICSVEDDTMHRLPAAQEALYPVHAKTAARDRWNWAITRVLRHVRQPPPASFQNPLRRETPLQTAATLPNTYSKVLDYSRVPPLNSGRIEASLTGRPRANLIKLCRQAGISIGSGAFTLAGIVMMRFEEARNPDIPHWQRLPFVGSFPVNPRPFLSGPPTTGKEDSLMLAFSDGVTLPFVPSDLDFQKTFRVLGRLAHRQLRQYQKRKRTAAEEVHLGSRNPRELLPALYLSTLERLDSKAKPEQRIGFSPQGAYPAKQSATLATCGISSVGDSTGLVTSGLYDLHTGKNDLVADYREMQNAVRPRDGEFLMAAIGTKESMLFGTSYDLCAIDPDKANRWMETIESILDFDMENDTGASVRGRLSKL